MLLESGIHWLCCVVLFFKLITSSRSYARKQKWVFFLNTVYINLVLSWSRVTSQL